MAFTFVQAVASATQNDLSVAMTATAGNLLIALAKWEGSAGGSGLVSVDDGTSPFALGPMQDSGTDMHAQVAYLLQANGGARTYTIDIAGTDTFHSLQLMEFSYQRKAVFDKATSAGSGGSSGTALATGNITLDTSGDGLQVAAFASYTSATFSAQAINSVAPTGTATGWRYTQLAYAFNASGTFQATATQSVSSLWAAHLLSFRDVPTIEQEGFRWRNDDGSETTATWKAAQDTNVFGATGTPLRVRFLVNAAGDLPIGQYSLRVRKVGDTKFLKVN